MNNLPIETQTRIIGHLVDGSGVRETARRLKPVSKTTVSRLALLVGRGCAALHHELVRNVQPSTLQLDEQHSWVHTRQIHLPKDVTLEDRGAKWTFVAFDTVSRLVVSFRVGDRSKEMTNTFVQDLSGRVVGVPTIYSDGWAPYNDAIATAFGKVHYARLVKDFSADSDQPNAPPGASRRKRYRGAVRESVQGDPVVADTKTSHVERLNLHMRTANARFVRRTIKHSKSIEHHCASIALMYVHHNFCRIHVAHGATPAMHVGLTDHPWSLEELIETALEMGTRPPTPLVSTPPTIGSSATAPVGGGIAGTDGGAAAIARRSRFRVIPGGKQ